MTSAALLLPRAFPDLLWLGTARRASRVLVHDTLFFDRKCHIHRGRIPTPDGPQYLYIPLQPAPPDTPLDRIRHEPTRNWLKALHKTLVMNYRNSIYFDFYEPEVMDDLAGGDGFEFFADFALHLTGRWLRYLDCPLEWTRASALPGRPVRPADIAAATGAGSLLPDPGGRHFQPVLPGMPAPLTSHPAYAHHFGFTPGCMVLDLLFSCGPESWKVVEAITPPAGT